MEHSDVCRIADIVGRMFSRAIRLASHAMKLCLQGKTRCVHKAGINFIRYDEQPKLEPTKMRTKSRKFACEVDLLE